MLGWAVSISGMLTMVAALFVGSKALLLVGAGMLLCLAFADNRKV